MAMTTWTDALTNPPAPPAWADWVPGPPARMSLARYEELIDSGAIGKRDKVQLINGYLVATMTHDPTRAVSDELTGEALGRTIVPGWHLRSSKPLRIPALESMPEPDRAVVRGAARDYAKRHPEPADVALVAEIADSSLVEDRKMAVLYGRAGVPAYWIINVQGRQVEAHWGPCPEGYRFTRNFTEGEHVSFDLDGSATAPIAVADLLP